MSLFCWLEITTSVSPVLWEMPSLFGTLKLLNVALSLGKSHSDCERCRCVCQHGVVLSVELFGAHVSWIVFSAFFFQGRRSCCLSLTTVCPHSERELQHLALGDKKLLGERCWVHGCGTHYTRRFESRKQIDVERGEYEGKSGRKNL